MTGLNLALVNVALANGTPGARVSAIEIVEHISGNGRSVSRIALCPRRRAPRGLRRHLTVAFAATVRRGLSSVSSEFRDDELS